MISETKHWEFLQRETGLPQGILQKVLRVTHATPFERRSDPTTPSPDLLGEAWQTNAAIDAATYSTFCES
jgi:hypothetical protein